MSDDIISRLRELAKPGTSLADVGGTCVFTEAANEIAHLREAIRRLADQDATLSVCYGSVTVAMDATTEILAQCSQRGGPLVAFDPAQPTLTDAERKAVELAIFSLQQNSGDRVGVAADNTLVAQRLRRLLERLA